MEVTHVTKRYGDHTVVEDLGFTVPPGRVTGFLGPNGSGKSTTMKIMLDLAAANEGGATIGLFLTWTTDPHTEPSTDEEVIES